MKYLILVLVLYACGCSNRSSNTETKPSEATNLELTHGYSFVYKQLEALTLSEKAFLVRNESDQVYKYVTEIADFARKLKKDFEAISEKQKNIKLDDTGQPKAESLMFDAISKDTAIKYIPVVGSELKIFERQILLSTVGLLNQIHFMFGAIMEFETSQERRDSLKQVHKETIRLRVKGLKILNKDYFKHNNFSILKQIMQNPGRFS